MKTIKNYIGGIFIEQSIYDKFREAFLSKIKQLKVGDPLDSVTDIGAIISEGHYKKILSYFELSQSEGGKFLTGGNSVRPEGRCKNGWFLEPTVIENLTFDCRTNRDEIFGPVVSLIPFANEEQVLKMVNNTDYVHASIIWTSNLSRAHRLAAELRSGIVRVNTWLLHELRTPFSGMNNSVIGREGGWEALRFFTEPKNVCIKP